jgi:hypothetical protein
MTDTPTPEKEMLDLTAAAERDAYGLSPMERRFAEAALDLIQSGERHWRAKAAEKAGYSDTRNAAYQLIRRPRIVAFMSKSLTEAAEDVKVDRAFILFRALTNLTACEANGDYRTAHRYLDMIAKHADVRAFTVAPEGGDQGARLSLPFDPSALNTDELATMIGLMRKAAGGQPTE